MPDPDAIAAFLRAAGWDDAGMQAIAGDASARRFTRLVQRGGETAILMDASGDATGSSRRFAALAGWINARGFSAPRILASAPDQELLLVEDFGDRLFARLLEEDPRREMELYTAAAEFLCAFQRNNPPAGLTPLDGRALAVLTALVEEWYIPAVGAGEAPATPLVAPIVETLYSTLAGGDPLVVSLRDFHAENVVWLPERKGPARLGLLDFQDAVAAHPAYDLVSFLQDARRDIRPETERAIFTHYCQSTGHEPARFAAVYALIGAQRALRILGVFARLILQAGKPRYARFLPRVWRHLQSDLAHPALAPLADAVRAIVPEPTTERIGRLLARCPAA